jgi:Ca2+:H+ antiporter
MKRTDILFFRVRLDSAELTPVTLFIVELRSILFAGWINILTIFVPIGLITYVVKAQPTLIFLTNAVAIVPLSALLTEATERIADDAGDTIGALLNISLGNIVELILL